MQANGARLQLDRTLWARWRNVHAWVEGGHLLAEPINDRAEVTVYGPWGDALARFAFRRGQWRNAESGADPGEFDESLAGRVSPGHEVLPDPALALAAQGYRSRRPIRTPIVPGDEKVPREDSAIVQRLIRGAIGLFFAGWLVVWLAWVTYVVWKVWTRLRTGDWPKLTLRDLGFHFHFGWSAVQGTADYVLDLGLGWTFLLAGTAVYVVLGGIVLFFLFMAIKLVEALIRAVYSTATAGAGNRLQ
jgi:hypothetical protein